ncbi:hypothetical protein [Methanoregula sp.]|uniref:hypothetical protein n=1 Tax=Methanoregula sp. TaxID=2052170 RepID=UPI0035647C16
MAESDHDILIEVRSDLKNLIESQKKLEKVVYGEDGQGGLCGSVQTVKNQQSRWIGRDGAILVLVPIAISILAVWLGKVL